MTRVNKNVKASLFGKLEVTEDYFKSPKVLNTIKKILKFMSHESRDKRQR
jgi:hypothetical protein